MGIEEAKQAAAKKAASYIQPGMMIGLGSGSTAEYFISALAARKDLRDSIHAVASSQRSAELAKKEGIEVLDLNTVSKIDITVDGADEIDLKNRMIKGGGGAHIREKILAANSQKMIVIADERKLVPSIGTQKLPVEIIPYGAPFSRKNLEALGFQGHWRTNHDGTLFMTENGNCIFDIHGVTSVMHPEKAEEMIRKSPGIVDTGFFFHFVDLLILGKQDGNIQLIEFP